MDLRYESYAVSDKRFYEPLARCNDHSTRLPAVTRAVPDGWRREQQGVWTVMLPSDGVPVPDQGWKVHLSATPDGAGELVDAVWAICQRLSVPWKFLRSRFVVTVTNSKYAPRASSGKVVTVYPRTAAELHDVVAALDTELGGTPGPYVLSDLRFREGPVYLRYGAFVPMWCEQPDGSKVAALRDAAGTLVPDRRTPGFTLPDGVTLPEFWPPLDETPAEARVGDYVVTKALHFSNAGGVYLAEGPDGRTVVLKEARPHAGLDARGRDAVHRLRNEHRTLERLGHLDFVPEVYGYFTAWEHEYLVIEYIEGRTVAAWLGAELPLLRHRPGPEALRTHAARVTTIFDEVERCLLELHATGVAYGDLHSQNIVLRPDGRVVLLDFELAADIDGPHHGALGAPGFSHPSLTSARDADLFALACCRLTSYGHMTALMAQQPAIAGSLLTLAARTYGLSAGTVQQMTDGLRRAPALQDTAAVGGPPDPPAAADLIEGIRAAATLGRPDRLYPGDIGLDRPGGAVGLAYGASGVLLALQAAQVRVPDNHLDWLAEACRRAGPDTPSGLYDGLAGGALVLHRLGATYEAGALIDRILDRPPPRSASLYDGRTGLAQLLLDVGRESDGLRLAQTVADQAGDPDALRRPGLMRGWSGPAVLFARCALLTGDPRWTELAEQALLTDLRHGRRAEGTLQLLTDGKLLPYLNEGSAGVALAALALPPETRVPVTEIVLAAARAGAVEAMAQGGLFNGRAGIVYLLAHVATRWPDWHEALADQRRLLSLHAAPVGNGRVLHGDQLIRLSTDLATGSAGALLALTVADEPDRAALPGALAPVAHHPVEPVA
ncbi:class III lanthionine synthetase LanKC [Winogradskya consettensis]|uniref:non-specific serine/threonine protein kinase n=1 Tax=Winogradskya consettensis TaxID=113560 RepID=A0A919SF76_9ACTN|nr:class III lanthionine synthetase LanKC [Actinoplanes consettensis]GIM71565.1 serine/threonine protein kinase [Actinoplanes consettensis]